MGTNWYGHYGRRMTDAERQKIYASRHPEKIKERNARRDLVKDYARQRELIQQDPRPYLLKCARKRAKKTGREFSITIDDIVVPSHCPVLGLELTVLSEASASHNSMSLDRIDNNLGYVPGNVIVVSYRANTLKKDASVEELEAIVNFYKRK